MSFVDFASLKASITIEEVTQLLRLDMKQAGNQLRGICPACKTTGGRELVVTPSKSAFYCFAEKKGGDLIALTAHIRGESIKNAALYLADQIGTVKIPVPTSMSTSTSSQESRQPVQRHDNSRRLAPTCAEGARQTDDKLEKIAARLEHDHPEVQAIGFTPEVAEALGIGYDKRGIMKGRVLFPLYDDGGLAGFIGYAADLQPALKLPPKLAETPVQSNVVRFPKAS